MHGKDLALALNLFSGVKYFVKHCCILVKLGACYLMVCVYDGFNSNIHQQCFKGRLLDLRHAYPPKVIAVSPCKDNIMYAVAAYTI